MLSVSTRILPMGAEIHREFRGPAGPALSPGGGEGSNVCVDAGPLHLHTLGGRFLSPWVSEWAGHLLLDSEGHLARMLAVGRCPGKRCESDYA